MIKYENTNIFSAYIMYQTLPKMSDTKEFILFYSPENQIQPHHLFFK